MAIQFGRSLRWYNPYETEIAFSETNAFDCMQIWFRKGKLLIDQIDDPIEVYLKKYNYPLLIHAVFEMDDFAAYGDRLIELLIYFEHTQVIIHPVFPSTGQPITDQTIYDLAKNIKHIHTKLKKNGITLFIENNSRLEKANYTKSDLEIVFTQNPEVELLLDIAHIDSYNHLQDILSVKYPNMLHISDKHFSVEHEHLPIGRGDLDFEFIFKKHLNQFSGKIILEIPDEDTVIVDSLNKIKQAMRHMI